VGTNRYAYAGGDPVNGSDPGGNVAKTPLAFGGVKSWAVVGSDNHANGNTFGGDDRSNYDGGTGSGRVTLVCDCPVNELGFEDETDRITGALQLGPGASPSQIGGPTRHTGDAVSPLGYNGPPLLGGPNSVYTSRAPAGAAVPVEYVGMSRVFTQRAATHLRDSARVVREVATNLTTFGARALEQGLIERYGLAQLSNIRNSIAASNPIYGQARQAADILIRHFGL
jgi:hypothetical protein